MSKPLRSLNPANGSRRAAAGWLAGATCLLASSAAMATQVYNPQHLAPDAIARVGEICTQGLGLPRAASSDYYVCKESLSHALVNLPAGTQPFTGQLPTPRAYYWDASNGEQHRRQQTVCSAIGYAPQTWGNAACVADLDSRLFAVANPTDK